MADKKSARGIEAAWPLPVVILAGGTGGRLSPFVDKVPKALVEVNGEAIVDRIIGRFRAQGCGEFWITTRYLAEKLEEHFGNVGPGYRVHLVGDEGHLGTAAPLRVLQGLVDPPFVLSNCDVLVDTDYPSAYRRHVEHGDAITLVAYRHRRVIPAGAIEIAADGGFGGFGPRREINELLYTGVCIVGPKALSLLGGESPLELPDLVMRCREAGLRVGVETVEGDAFLDMGTFAALARMSQELKKVEGDRTAIG